MSKYTEMIRSFLEKRSTATQKAYRRVYLEWVQHVGESKVMVATMEDVESFIDSQMKKEGAVSRVDGNKMMTWATVHYKYRILAKIHDHLTSARRIQFNPFRGVEIPSASTEATKRPPEIIDLELVEALLNLPDEYSKEGIRDRAILAALVGGGLRRSEILKLEIRHYKRTLRGTPFLKLMNTKNKQSPDHAIQEWSAKRLEKHIEERIKDGASPSDPMFVHYSRSNKMNLKPFGDKWVYMMVRRYCKALRLSSHITTHSARHTAITQLILDGKTFDEVRKFSRHKDIRMVERYFHNVNGVDNSPGTSLGFGSLKD